MPPWQKYNLLEDHIEAMVEAALHPRLAESIEETQEVWGREELSIDEQIRIAVEKDNWQERRRGQYG